MEDFMKKTRRILSFIVAMAMIMSMSTLCFLVTADGTRSTTVITDTEWKLGVNAFEIGEAGSTALLEKGPFKLDHITHGLNPTVSEDGYIMTTDGLKSYTKSANGIIDFDPDAGEARLAFVAPADGTYSFIVCLENDTMPEYATTAVKAWTQIGATTSIGAGFGGWTDIVGTNTYAHGGKLIENNPEKYNAVYERTGTVTLTAGQCINISVAPDGGDARVTLKTFNVYKLSDYMTWDLSDFVIGDEGSAAIVNNGIFKLSNTAGALSNVVTMSAGTIEDPAAVAVESIVTTEGSRAFTKSANGIIDLTPANGTTSKVTFTAPVAGTYYYELALERVSTTELALRQYIQCGKTPFKNADRWGYCAVGFANGTQAGYITATTYTATRVADLEAGETIEIAALANSGDGNATDETQVAINTFKVMKVADAATIDKFASTIGTPEELGTVTANNFTLGSINSVTNDLEGTSFRPVDATKLVPAWAGATNYYAWSVFVNEADRPIFGTSQTGSSMDMMPKNAVPSVITYTATEDGVYKYDATFKRSNGSSDKTLYMIVGTGNEAGAYEKQISKTEIAANETLPLKGTVELKAGDTIWFVAENSAAAQSAEVGVRSIEVIRIEEHVCHEWNDDATCMAANTCVVCDTPNANDVPNPNNHVGEPTGYTDNGDGTHTVEYADCCNATGITEVHNFTEGGTCSMGTCGATLNAESEDYVISFNPYGDKEVNNEETVAVELQISGSATHYASGKIVVYYDADVFTFVGATGTLSDVTVDSNVDGKLVIVMYGDDHELTEDLQTFATLTFKAKKLTAPEKSDIVLGDAGFSTQALAETEDLTPAIKYYSTLSVVVNARVFDVELDSDLAGEGTATEGADYGFTPETVTGAYYNYSNLVVMVDDDNDGVAEKDITEFVQGTGNGPWTIPGQYVTGELAITVDRTEKTYSVTIVDGQGNDVSTSWIVGFVNEATYGTDYVFEVIPDPWTQEHGGIKYVVESVMAGTTDRTANRSNQLYTITGTDITGDIVITMSGNEYDATGVDVVFDGPGTTGNEPFAPLGDDYLFNVTFDEGYIYTIQYKVGAEGTLKTPDLVDGKYVVPAADFADELADTIYVFVTRVEDVANLEVYEYLTLNNGVKLYLVLNDTAKLENSHFTMNGEAMFWSDRYNAYCYLVASSTVVDADVAATYTYTVAAGAAAEVDYGMDVNKSGKMDANDAQLVYNMYMFEYEGFTSNVTVEKYLRADVSADVDYKVDAADATAIANACLNN